MCKWFFCGIKIGNCNHFHLIKYPSIKCAILNICISVLSMMPLHDSRSFTCRQYCALVQCICCNYKHGHHDLLFAHSIHDMLLSSQKSWGRTPCSMVLIKHGMDGRQQCHLHSAKTSISVRSSLVEMSLPSWSGACYVSSDYRTSMDLSTGNTLTKFCPTKETHFYKNNWSKYILQYLSVVFPLLDSSIYYIFTTKR